MPRKYQKVIEVTYSHTNDGNHFLVSIRYGAVTINGLRYTRSTNKGKQQLIWPRYRLPVGDRFVDYPAIRPMKGFTQHVIACIEEYLRSDKNAVCLMVPETVAKSSESDKVDSPAPPATPTRVESYWVSPCCKVRCTQVYDNEKRWIITCSQCGHEYSDRDDSLVWESHPLRKFPPAWLK